MALFIPNIASKSELGHTLMRSGLEASGQSWKTGAPLVWSSGKLAEASANPRDIVGWALSTASGTANTKVTFVAAMPGIHELEMCVDKASGLGTHQLAQTDVGAVYGITKSAGGIWYIDIDKVTAGTNTAVSITELIDPIGATTADTPTNTNTGGARVRCVLLSEASFLQTAAS